MNPIYTKLWACWLLALSTALPISVVRAQDKRPISHERDSLIAAALDVMKASRYCVLITVDSAGQPHARAMDPFPPEEVLTIWLGTNSRSRKVREIRDNPRVTLYYADPEGGGYMAHLILFLRLV
jgi:predicted pyridoxine 5'-phosphate oxidase superfamily flavin-nucleotide-binding protein